MTRWTKLLSLLLCTAAVPALGLTGCSGETGDEASDTAESSQAATVQEAGFTDSIIVNGIANPTAMTFAPDGRLFVAQQGGALRVVKNNALLSTAFLNVSVSSSGERGLIGVAVDPNFSTNNFVYVYYTTTGTVHNRVSRFTANGDVAVSGSELVLLDLPNLSGATNHNGGALHFGPDGKLYIAVGENANTANSQSLTTRLGKMLRVNSNGTIPADNPYLSETTGVNQAIWAIGLRNPFTFAFEPGTGTMFINDVGANAFEEINRGQPRGNYGWPQTEGDFTQASFPNYIRPFFNYGRSLGCAIAGGTFYNPVTVQFPSGNVGRYFFADYCNGWIRKTTTTSSPPTVSVFATGLSSPVDLDVGLDGALYYLQRGNGGQIGRISFTANAVPTITSQPANASVAAGGSATFTVSAGGSSPFTYQWRRGGANISGATSSSYTLSNVLATDNQARFSVVVTNQYGTVTSSEAILTVQSGQPPVATISTPAVGTTFTGGSLLSFSGSGADTEDGALPASALTWKIDFHHASHTHPAMADTSGIASGNWSIPSEGETATDVFYRVYLTVRDSAGLTHTSFRDVVPVVTDLTVTTSPPGLQITVDGQPFTAPYVTDSVVGMRRQIGASSPQIAGGQAWAFASWSDGGTQAHDLTTPASPTTYAATFTETTMPICGSNALTRVSATSSSNENATHVANNARDGNLGTRWSSAFMNNQWIYIDLGATKKIRRVVLRWEAAYSNNYRIEVTDNPSGTWTVIRPNGAGDGGVDDLTGLSGTGRYVRMFANTRATAYGNSLWEFEVYGDDNPTCITPACGNGILESGEQCDDGNTVDNDACRNSCVASTCADGLQNQGESGVDCGGPCATCAITCTSVALSRPSAVASSTENATHVAMNARDGNLGTRWSSAFMNNQWIYIDLGATKKIRRVVLRWEAAYSNNYRIEVTDDPSGTWTVIRPNGAGDGGVDDLTGLNGTGRYVRMFANTRATVYGNSLWEFEVYGDNNPNCTP